LDNEQASGKAEIFVTAGCGRTMPRYDHGAPITVVPALDDLQR
jgi:hypothetical protein